MATTADFKNGLCIEYNNDIFTIVEFLHVKPGKGPAFVRTKLRSLTSGKVIDNTFNSGVKVTTARVEMREHQFLYKDDMGFHLMDTESYDEIVVNPDLIAAQDLIKDGQLMQVMYHTEKDTILGCELPPFVILQVTYSEPGLKGDTATNATKHATLETGAQVRVPLFINEGDMLKIDTRTHEYVERMK